MREIAALETGLLLDARWPPSVQRKRLDCRRVDSNQISQRKPIAQHWNSDRDD